MFYEDILVRIGQEATRPLYEGALARGQEEGRWEVDEMPVISVGIHTMCIEVDGWYRDGGRLSPEQIGAAFADFVRRGLGGSPARERRGAKEKGRSR